MNLKKFKFEKKGDNRGYLLELISNKINFNFKYSILTTSKKNVIRGLHFDKMLNENKVIFVQYGKINDFCVDLRKGKNYGKIYKNVLLANEGLYIPKGYAHGYSCKQKINTIIYFLSKKYHKKNHDGIIWNDKTLAINWGVKKPIISDRDKKLKNF